LLKKSLLGTSLYSVIIRNNESGFTPEDPDQNYLKRSRSPSPLSQTYPSFQKINTGKHVQKARANPSIIRKYKKSPYRQPIFIPNVGTSKNVVHGLGKWQSTLSNHIIIQKLKQP